jgi:hypothetical protein
MFTNEMDHDETIVTILDDGGFYEDVQIYLYEDIVIIRQWDEDSENFKEVGMSPEMFDQFLIALNSPIGTFQVK